MNSISNQKSRGLLSAIVLIAVMLIIGVSVSFNAVPANAQDTEKKTEIFEVEKNETARAVSEKSEESAWYDNIIVLIIGIIVIIIVLFVIYICLPVLPLFQSKLKPESVVEHIGEAKGGKGKKVLLGYVTRHGTSSSIAQKIYDVLIEKGHDVDMRFLSNIGDDEVSKYDFFIIGSSVYWVMAPEFIEFVTKHRELLSNKPVAVFATCMTIQRDTPKNRERVEAYFDSGLKKVTEIKPIDKEPFAGKVDMSKLNSMEIAFLKFLFLITPLKGGDHRDWNKIEAWAEKISEKI